MCMYVKGASSTTPWINILSYDTVTVPASLPTIKQRVGGLNMMFNCCTLSELFVIQITSDNKEAGHRFRCGTESRPDFDRRTKSTPGGTCSCLGDGRCSIVVCAKLFEFIQVCCMDLNDVAS